MKSCHSAPVFKDTVAYLNTQGNTEDKLTWKWAITNKHPWDSLCSFFYNRYPRIKTISKDNNVLQVALYNPFVSKSKNNWGATC